MPLVSSIHSSAADYYCFHGGLHVEEELYLYRLYLLFSLIFKIMTIQSSFLSFVKNFRSGVSMYKKNQPLYKHYELFMHESRSKER